MVSRANPALHWVLSTLPAGKDGKPNSDAPLRLDAARLKVMRSINLGFIQYDDENVDNTLDKGGAPFQMVLGRSFSFFSVQH